jgi:predicted N-formylglutamate amidohydrolase
VTRLLAPHEPPAVILERPDGRSPILLTCDHASKRIPERLNQLGLPECEIARHIGWDIGALGVARRLSAEFDATLIAQNYSRLVIDCNRHFWRHDSIPTVSEATTIAANEHLSEDEKTARQQEIVVPYRSTIERAIAARKAANRPLLYVSVHSFTPVYLDVPRPQHIGLLSNRDRRLTDPMLEALREEAALCVGDNAPYRLTDEGDYGVPVYAEQAGIPYALIEMRQDLIAAEAGQAEWAARLARVLRKAAAAIGVEV